MTVSFHDIKTGKTWNRSQQYTELLTKSGSVNSFCGSKGSAGDSFNTMLAVFDIITADAKSQTEYNFYKRTHSLSRPTKSRSHTCSCFMSNCGAMPAMHDIIDTKEFST